jgi:hypothetical protein
MLSPACVHEAQVELRTCDLAVPKVHGLILGTAHSNHPSFPPGGTSQMVALLPWDEGCIHFGVRKESQ